MIKGLCLGLTVILMGDAIAAVPFSGGVEGMIQGWKQILIAPCPLITDYFGIGGISATFFNAAICSFACWMIAAVSRARVNASFLAAYLLVVAHCFYGMNFLNIWPCYIGVILYYIKLNINF